MKSWHGTGPWLFRCLGQSRRMFSENVSQTPPLLPMRLLPSMCPYFVRVGVKDSELGLGPSEQKKSVSIRNEVGLSGGIQVQEHANAHPVTEARVARVGGLGRESPAGAPSRIFVLDTNEKQRQTLQILGLGLNVGQARYHSLGCPIANLPEKGLCLCESLKPNNFHPPPPPPRKHLSFSAPTSPAISFPLCPPFAYRIGLLYFPFWVLTEMHHYWTYFSPPDRKGLLDFMLESAFVMLLHHAPTQYPARAALQWIRPSIPPEQLVSGSRRVSRQSCSPVDPAEYPTRAARQWIPGSIPLSIPCRWILPSIRPVSSRSGSPLFASVSPEQCLISRPAHSGAAFMF